MPTALISAGVGAAGSIIGGIIQGNASSKAAAAAEAAQAKNVAFANDMYSKDTAIQQPYMTAGANASSRLSSLYAPGGQFSGFNYNPNADPSTQFRFNEGERATAQLGNAQYGGAMNGNTQKALVNYGQQAASQEYSNAFGRYMQQAGLSTGALQGQTQIGANASNSLLYAGNNTVNAVTGANTNSGDAAAGGIIRGANSISNAITGVTTAGNKYLSSYTPPPAKTGA